MNESTPFWNVKDNDTYEGNSTCRRMSCASPIESRTCYCDASCTVFGDCCLDAPTNLSTQAVDKADLTWADHSTVLMKQFASCRNFSNMNYYMVVDSCPVDFRNTQMSRKCSGRRSSDLRSIAVSVMNKTDVQIVFRNSDCAKCHGYVDNDIVHWESMLQCSEPILEGDSEESIASRCLLLQYPSHAMPYPRRCTVTKVSHCPEDFSDHNITKKCLEYADAVYPEDNSSLLYKNEYCAYCNGMDVNQTKPLYCKSDYMYTSIHGDTVSLTYLFSFDNDFLTLHSSSGTKTVIPSCDQGQGYFSVIGRCLDISCPMHFELVDDKCSPKYSPVPAMIDNGHLTMPMLRLGTNFSQDSLDDEFVISQVKTNCSMDVDMTKNNSSLVQGIFFKFRENGSGVNLYTEIECVLKIFRSLDRKNKVSMTIQNYVQLNNDLCPYGVHKEQIVNLSTDLSLYHASEYFEQTIEINNSNISLRLSELGFQIAVDNQWPNIALRKVYYCLNSFNFSYQKCSEYFAFDQFKVIGEKGFVQAFNESFEVQSFLMENSTLYVCNKPPSNFQGSMKDAFIYDYFLRGYLGASFLSLVVVITIYLCLPSIYTLHGRCLTSFCLTLSLSNLSWLLETYLPEYVCRAFAIVTHFLLLSMFLWNSVLAYDLARKLSICTLMTTTQHNDKSLFVRYSVFAWVLPGCFVTVCFIVDEIHEGKVIGYGHGITGTCWINNQIARLILFHLPVAILLFLNIVFLLSVVCGIESARRAARNIKKTKKDVSKCLVYTKISLMLGMTWLLSFLAAAVNEQWLYLVYSTVNSLQGVLILLGVLCSKTVVQQLRSKVKRHLSLRSSDAESTTDTRL